MKNIKPLSNIERQARHRDALAQKDGKRLSVSLSRESVAALEVIQQNLRIKKQPATKRAAIEAALLELAYGWSAS